MFLDIATGEQAAVTGAGSSLAQKVARVKVELGLDPPQEHGVAAPDADPGSAPGTPPPDVDGEVVTRGAALAQCGQMWADDQGFLHYEYLPSEVAPAVAAQLEAAAWRNYNDELYEQKRRAELAALSRRSVAPR